MKYMAREALAGKVITGEGCESGGAVADRLGRGGGLNKAGVRIAGEWRARDDRGVVPGHRVAGAARRKPGRQRRQSACAW